ncbi:hypothetical protein OROMI_007947 [Orobanche minor]
MDADEKLTALKKAYADIILSISKEAAARVMSSERKSVRYQHELKVTKDEGLRMLLRLKQMLDSQIRESQATSLNQQKKIDELEAQLQEAEDIVSDLRGELQEVQAELARVKNKNSHHAEGPIDAYSSEIQLANTNIYSYQSVDFLPPIEPSVATHVSTPCPTRDLPSIILRGKETGLCRNGCTQRIRACDRNLLDRDLSLPEENAEMKDKKNGKEKLDNKLSADIKLDGFDSFLMKRKRAVRQRKTIIPLDSKKSHISEEGARFDGNPSDTCARLSPDKDLRQTQMGYDKISVNERNLVEISSIEEMDSGKVDGPSSGLQLNPSEGNKGLLGRPVRERDFKYTFQRKRKKQALSKSEGNGSLETGKITVNEKSGDLKAEEPKRSLSMESAWDSRRLAQVARQTLIFVREQVVLKAAISFFQIQITMESEGETVYSSNCGKGVTR